MAYEFTLLALPFAVALVVTTFLWIQLWQHRHRRAAKGFLIDVTGVVLLSAVMTMKLTATDFDTKLFWWNARFLPVSLMAIGYMLMAVEYTDNEHLISRPVGAALVAITGLVQYVAWTNGTDGLFYTATGLENGLLVPSLGPLYWVFAATMVGFLGIGVVLLVRLFYSRSGFGAQTGVLVGTISLVMLGVILWWLRIVPIDLLALTSTLKVVGFYFAVARLRLLDTLPVARETVFENMDDAVFVLSDTGRIVDVNPAAERLVGDRGGIHESIDDVLWAEITDEVATADIGSMDDDTIAEHEITIDQDGEIRHYDLEVSGFPGGTGAVLVLRDITERRNREEEIAILNRIVRHDIRNEMNVLQGRLEIIEPHIDSDAADDYAYVQEAAQHVVELTDTVRELMEVITSDGTMDVHAVSLQPVLEKEVRKVRSNFPEATVELGDVPPIHVEGNEMLSSVFSNLLNNAVVHNDSSTPRIEVHATVDDGRVLVSVADDGPGVPPDRRAEIFGRGKKGMGSEGTGIGLYLVDALTTAFGGDVRINDAELGGAAFVVELAVASDSISRSEPVASPDTDD